MQEISVAAQNAHALPSGAYTGEISYVPALSPTHYARLMAI